MNHFKEEELKPKYTVSFIFFLREGSKAVSKLKKINELWAWL